MRLSSEFQKPAWGEEGKSFSPKQSTKLGEKDTDQVHQEAGEVDLGRAGGGRVDVTKVLKVLTQEGWGKEGYQTPGRSWLEQTAVAIRSREIEEGRHGKLEIREASWDEQSPTDEPANYCHGGGRENVDEHVCMT